MFLFEKNKNYLSYYKVKKYVFIKYLTLHFFLFLHFATHLLI